MIESSTALHPREFQAVSELIYRIAGINLHDGKEGLVRTRLAKRLQALRIGSYAEYLEFVESDESGQELSALVDALTTNKTSFFREAQHFDFVRQRVLPDLLATGRPIRFWSAGCSSGEEPYTLGMVLHEEVPDLARRDVRILATDISSRVLARARDGLYEAATVEDVAPQLRQRYFTREAGQPARYRVKPSVRSLVRLARLNLMGEWPMAGPFDAIFCRNVMIYFDKSTQERLVNRFWELLAPGGHLFVGHSESLTALSHRFAYVQPATYVK